MRARRRSSVANLVAIVAAAAVLTGAVVVAHGQSGPAPLRAGGAGAYDLADRITSAGFAYDDNGNLTADPSRTFAYDAFGRLASVTASGTTTTYTLDGLGNRLAETTGVITTAFDLDLAAANPTILADGTRRYLPGAPGAGYDLAGTWWSSLTDLSGSPIRSVSQTGATTAAVHRDPYGNARPGSTLTSGIGYTGEWADPTGLVNLRARAYDPLTGRFTARDTFGGVASAPQSGNRYAYALLNPLRYSDPSGRFVNWTVSNGPTLASLVIQALPGVGDAYSFLIGVIGYDPIAGISLSDADRGLAIASAVVLGGGFWLAGRLAGDVARDSRTLGHLGDEAGGFGGLGRAADSLPTGGVDNAVIHQADEAGGLGGAAARYGDEAGGVGGLARDASSSPVAAPVAVTNRGRRGSPATQAQLDDIRDTFLSANPNWRHVAGGRDAVSGQRLAEEYLANPVSGRRGSAWPDLTFEGPGGDRIRINTVDVLASGRLTPREWRNFERIFELTGEPVIAIPKVPR